MTDARDRLRRPSGVALALSAGLAAELALHFLEPRLAITWSHAHLGRRGVLPWIGAALVLVLPAASAWVWRRPGARRPLGALSWRAAAAAAALGAAVLALGRLRPAPLISIDPWFLVKSVAEGTGENGRWYLLLWSYQHLGAAVQPWLDAPHLIRTVSGLAASVALVALAGAARRLGRTRGEAGAIALVAWTAFGVAQLVPGYLDVYPFALAVTALYLWTALGVLAGDVHPGWPLVIAFLAPFFYIGLVLLVPSTVVIALAAARRPAGGARLALGLLAAVAAAGAATLPGFGAPFAWAAFVARAHADSGYQLGFSPTSSLLPLRYMLSGAHAREVVHTLLLVDGVGVVLLVVCGGWLVLHPRTWSPPAALLALVVLPYLAYVVAMDPLFGALADWDLFSYGAAATSLLGAYAFVVWGREHERAFAWLLGLAIASAGVHLLARWNALDVDLPRHLLESPYHAQ